MPFSRAGVIAAVSKFHIRSVIGTGAAVQHLGDGLLVKQLLDGILARCFLPPRIDAGDARQASPSGAEESIERIARRAAAHQRGGLGLRIPEGPCCGHHARPVIDDVPVLDQPALANVTEGIEIAPADVEEDAAVPFGIGLVGHVIALDEHVAVSAEIEQRVADDVLLAETFGALEPRGFQAIDEAVHGPLVGAVVVGAVRGMAGFHQRRVVSIGAPRTGMEQVDNFPLHQILLEGVVHRVCRARTLTSVTGWACAAA